MPIFDSSKIPSAAEIISLHTKRKEKEIKNSRFQPDRYNRPAIFELSGIKFAAPTDNEPPANDWQWEFVGTYKNRKVYQSV